jgi:hypothetical protein
VPITGAVDKALSVAQRERGGGGLLGKPGPPVAGIPLHRVKLLRERFYLGSPLAESRQRFLSRPCRLQARSRRFEDAVELLKASAAGDSPLLSRARLRGGERPGCGLGRLGCRLERSSTVRNLSVGHGLSVELGRLWMFHCAADGAGLAVDKGLRYQRRAAVQLQRQEAADLAVCGDPSLQSLQLLLLQGADPKLDLGQRHGRGTCPLGRRYLRRCKLQIAGSCRR